MSKRTTKQHDALESTAAMEKRLGITAKTRKAAEAHAARQGRLAIKWYWGSFAAIDFLAGVRWERRRRAKDGY